MVHLVLLLVALIFGINHVWAKDVFTEIPPYAVAAFRVIFGAIVLIIVQRTVSGEKLENKRDLLWLAVYSLFGVIINQVCYLKGLSMTTSANTSILIVTIPVFTTAIAIALRKEYGSLKKWIGIGLAAGGVLALHGLDSFDASRDKMIGNLLVVINSFSYATYLVISKGLLKKYSSITVAMWIYIFGFIGVAPLGAGEIAALDFGAISMKAWLPLIYVLIFSTVVVYFLNLWALRRAESSTVAVYIYLQPVIATGLAAYLGRESITMAHGVSAGLIFAGVYLTTISANRKSGTPKEADV
jgi:drug/metabolite transporter (DMT)-like permease